MKKAKSYGLLMVGFGLLVVAGVLGWKERDVAEYGLGGARDSHARSGPSGGEGKEQPGSVRSARRPFTGEVTHTFEEMVVIFKEAGRERPEDEAVFLRFAETIPLERWPRLVEELEKDNPPWGCRQCVTYWGKVDPEGLLEFLRAGRFRFNTSGWKASMVLVEHFAPRNSELAITLYGEWEEAHNVDIDRDSWSRPMVENIASQERHSNKEKFEAWFEGLAEHEKEWALEVAPEGSVIR